MEEVVHGSYYNNQLNTLEDQLHCYEWLLITYSYALTSEQDYRLFRKNEHSVLRISVCWYFSTGHFGYLETFRSIIYSKNDSVNQKLIKTSKIWQSHKMWLMA